jgi:hypothetical protein
MSERDYKREYALYHSTPQHKRERAMRNKWNRRLSPPPGYEIDHRNALRNGGSNDRTNLRIRSVHTNRADNGHTKSAYYHQALWAAFAAELASSAHSADLTRR